MVITMFALYFVLGVCVGLTYNLWREIDERA